MVVCSVSQLLADTVSHRQSKQVADKHSLWQRTRRQPGTVYIRIPRSRQLPLASITHLARGQARRLTPPAGMSRLMYADTRLSLIQAPQVTAWLSHAHLTLPHQVTSWPKHTLPLPPSVTAWRSLARLIRPSMQPLPLKGARELLQAPWRRLGRRARAALSVSARAPPAPSRACSYQVAGALPQQCRGQTASARCGANERGSISPRRAHKPQQALRQPHPPLPCRPIASPAAYAVAAATTYRPYMHLDSCCGRQACARRRPPGLAACARCARFAPEPISSATSRPHGCSAAAAQGALCARDRLRRCLQGLSPARACRAGRMPACLCAQHQQGARRPRR